MGFIGVQTGLPTGSYDVASTGLVASWDMSTLRSAKMQDFQDSFDLTINGAPEDVPGFFDRARKFVANAADYLEVAHDVALDPQLITMVAWFTMPAAAAGVNIFISKHVGATPGCRMQVNHPGGLANPRFVARVGGVDRTSGVNGPTMSKDVVHSAVGTYDGDVVRFFLDGSPYGDTVTISGTIDDNTNVLRVGQQADGGSPLRADVHGALIFNRALSAAEVLQIGRDGRPAIFPYAASKKAGI